MANKRKKLNMAKHLPKPDKPKAKKEKKVSPDVELVKDVKSIQGKYDKPIKSPVRELGKIKDELSDLRSPLYKLRAKFKKETRKTYADKLRKQIKSYEKQITPKIEHLVEKRDDVKHLKKQFTQIRVEKRKKRSKIASIDRAIDKAEENGDYKQVEKLTYEKLRELGMIDSLNESLGMPVHKIEVDPDYEAEEDSDSKGFLEDDANPYGIWEAVKKLNEDKDSGAWDYIIINGKRMSTNSKILLISEASTWWLILKAKSKTPYVLRYFNYQTKTVKYIEYK